MRRKCCRESANRLDQTATVKSVFGKPIHAEGKTVVPVAKVTYGFGAGGGGGVRAFPAGVLEITPENTRFIPFTDARLLAFAFAAGIALGAMVFGRRLRN
jgi:uncharacterized spore protein YtfJ